MKKERKRSYLGIDPEAENVFAVIGNVTVGKTVIASKLLGRGLR